MNNIASDVLGTHGTFKSEEYSWMDPPVCDEAVMRKLMEMEMMGGLHRIIPDWHAGEYGGDWGPVLDRIKKALVAMEKETEFFERQLIQTVLGRFSKTLLEVVMIGMVDRKWMEKVVEVMPGVTVRAQTVDMQPDEWVVVGPGVGRGVS